MTILLRAPLLPAAAVTVGAALLAQASDALALALAIPAATASAALALASADRPRALLWWATCAAAAGLALRLPLGDVPLGLAPPLGAIDALRAELARPLRSLVPEPESGVLLGIVLGERASVSRDLATAFAATGTTHLLAISGFNMTLVGTAVAFALRRHVRPVTRAITTVAAIVAYSVLVGPAPSVLRAALMASVAAVGLASGRRAATANALCAAATAMLLADPEAIADVGFQLSALATAGLVAWQAPLAARLARLPRPIGDGLATTFAATAPTLPLVAAAFGRVSLVSPLANLAAVPLFPPLMLAGAATAVVGVLSLDAARPAALLAYGCALALRGVVEAFAALPLASVTVPPGPLTGAALALLLAATAHTVAAVAARWPQLLWARLTPHAARLLVGRLAQRRIRAAAAGALAVAVVVAALVAWPAPAPEARVRALDVGQGDAYLVELAGATLLIDGGPDPGRLLDQLGASLPPWHRRIDVVALTHAHQDHGAGLLAVFDRYEVGLALEPIGLNAGPLADLWAEGAARARAPRRAVGAGQRLRVGDATVHVLSPEADHPVDTPSLVLRVERGRFSALFTGDATDDALADLLLRRDALRSRVYVPPHHGARTAHAAALVEAVRPEVALISVGAGNRYGHPTTETLAVLEGLATFRTDRDGTVEVSLDGPGLVVRAHANGLPPPRRGSLPYLPARR